MDTRTGVPPRVALKLCECLTRRRKSSRSLARSWAGMLGHTNIDIVDIIVDIVGIIVGIADINVDTLDIIVDIVCVIVDIVDIIVDMVVIL